MSNIWKWYKDDDVFDYDDETLITEYERRLIIKTTGGSDRLTDWNFEHQARFIIDRAPFQAALCTRRAGKSYGAALKMVREAIEFPNCNIGYLALTRFSAKAILWKDCLKDINTKFGLGLKFNETELTATFPAPINSVIYLSGADATNEEMEKFLGRKYRGVVIDEAASFRRDLKDLVFSVLKPAVADFRGWIALIGTPRSINKGLFYDVTQNGERGWSVHKWTTFDNPHMKTNWELEIKELKEMHLGIENTPAFKMNYLGEWVIDDDLRVYKTTENNLVKEIVTTDDTAFTLGVDLGYNPDPSAFVVSSVALVDGFRRFRVHEAFKQKNLIISDVAGIIEQLMRKYGPMRVVMDAANKQAVEEIKQKYGIPVVAADKHGKAGVIEVMNSDIIMGLVQIHEDAIELYNEHLELVWDDRSDKRQENAVCENHLSDAALYAWRMSFRQEQPEIKKHVDPYSIEALEDWEQSEMERIELKKRGEIDEY